MSIEDLVNNPKHYNSHWSGIEAIEFTEQLMGNLSNAFKYVYRHESKWNPIQDLEKAVWYLKRELKRLKQKQTFYLPIDLDAVWELDKKALPSHDMIYRIIPPNAAFMDKALFYIWCAQFRDFGDVVDSISIAIDYIELILEQKRQQLSNKENG